MRQLQMCFDLNLHELYTQNNNYINMRIIIYLFLVSSNLCLMPMLDRLRGANFVMDSQWYAFWMPHKLLQIQFLKIFYLVLPSIVKSLFIKNCKHHICAYVYNLHCDRHLCLCSIIILSFSSSSDSSVIYSYVTCFQYFFSATDTYLLLLSYT